MLFLSALLYFQYGKNIVLLEMITAIDTQCIKHKHELGNLISNNLYLCVFEAKHVLNRVLRQKVCHLHEWLSYWNLHVDIA